MKPQFSIFRQDGSLNPRIKRSFIRKEYINSYDYERGFLELEDGTRWELVVSPELEVAHSGDYYRETYCICSMQVWDTGNYAVCRIYREEKPTK